MNKRCFFKMSDQQQPQKMRRNNLSPKQGGPLKATVPFSLMHQACSPTRCLCPMSSSSNSPTNAATAAVESKIKSRNSPDSRISPESPTGKVEKSKVFPKPVNPSTYIRRTASVDTIYLLGQWQRDALYLSYCGRLMMDRATQTPEEFEEIERRPQKKTSAATNETLEMKFIRQRLQRTNHSNRGPGPSGANQKHSPVHGDHSAISPATGGGNTSPVVPSSTVSPHRQLSFHNNSFSAANSNNNNPVAVVSYNSNNASATYSSFAAASSCARALPIPIPDIPKPQIPRMRSSVEGLNQEIEKLVLREISSVDGSENIRNLGPTPEGHRAPIADLFHTRHSVDTQTPFNRRDSYPSSNSPTSRSNSISPVGPIIPGHMDTSRPSSTEDNISRSPDGDSLNKLATSPQINKFLAREPPDGCEKVKIAEEIRISTCLNDTREYRCLKPSVNFVLLPSQSSAFYPLCKNCVMNSPDENNVVERNSVATLSTSGERLQ